MFVPGGPRLRLRLIRPPRKRESSGRTNLAAQQRSVVAVAAT